jgi:hypothetical protein
MTTHCLDTPTQRRAPHFDPSSWNELATLVAPVITYAEPPFEDEIEDARTGTACCSAEKLEMTKRKCPLPLPRARRKSFTARARRQRRLELAAFEALPIVRRARAAGLHGAALRAYIAAVEMLDGPAAFLE